MKSIMNDVVEKAKYPYIGIARNKDDPSILTVVLFSGPKKGTVISSTSLGNTIGYHEANWTESHFKPYEGEIILSN